MCRCFISSQENGTTNSAKRVTLGKKKQSPIKKPKSPPKLNRYPPVVEKVAMNARRDGNKRAITSVTTPRGIEPILEPTSRAKRPATQTLSKFATPAKKQKVYISMSIMIWEFFAHSVLNLQPKKVNLNFEKQTYFLSLQVSRPTKADKVELFNRHLLSNGITQSVLIKKG